MSDEHDADVVETGGAIARRFGDRLELTVCDALTRARWSHRRHVRVGRRLWGDVCEVDVLVDESQCAQYPRGFGIECRWRSVKGSADEKFHCLAANILSGAYGVPVMVIVEGGGARPQALAWLRTQVDGHRFVAVHDVGEFLKWLNRHPPMPFALTGR